VTALVEGDVVWAIIGGSLAAWIVISAVVAFKSAPGVVEIFGWLLRSWFGRILMLLLWAESGWHLFTQRP
jgi:hypothetical protein